MQAEITLRQAAQQALEALTLSIPKPRPADDDYAELGWKEHNAAIAALRAALAEPEQEPVRLQCTTCGTVYADGVPPQVPERKPQTTHWEGCEAVHPECKEKNT